MIKRIAVLSVGGLLAGATLCAPVAHASPLWAAIVYKNDGSHSRYYNYPTKTKLIFDIQEGWGKSAGYHPFSSGSCAALVSYAPPLSDNETEFDTAVDDTLDGATSAAIRKALGAKYTLLDAFCQD